ncbi:hypothetical protein PISL3812_09882 [Talaromyces islandicus]|uniref:Uncharacterized protein n=1 Tax=Talaromyces islandicus TaxID=28573 RepID=A0A0U1MB28_TALIS|nr:hypothetical protein PISL3812_09882 [Talaromyces islandicus]
MDPEDVQCPIPFTAIFIHSTELSQNQVLHSYARSPQYCESLAMNLAALLTLEPALLQRTVANLEQQLPPQIILQFNPGNNIPDSSRPPLEMPLVSCHGTESDETPHVNDTMPADNDVFLEMDWPDTVAPHDLHVDGHQGLVNNAQSGVGFTSESRVPGVSDDPTWNTGYDADLAMDVAAALYPSPKSNPPHTPKFIHSALKRKVRKSETSEKRLKSRTASMYANRIALSPSEMPCSNDPNENGQLLFPDEAVRLNLLRSLAKRIKRPKRPFDIKKFRTIYQTGDKIISDTGILLNDLKEWLSEDYRTYGISLPRCHNLSSAEIATTMFRFLMETKNDEQQKSVYRRLAQVIFLIFVNIGVEQLNTWDKNEETVPRSGRNLTAIYHKSILASVGDLEVNAEAIHIDNRSNFCDSSLELLINYMRNAYPNAMAHFQSLNQFVQPLFANPPISTDQVVDLTGPIDPLYLKFSVSREIPDRVDTERAMKTATENLLQCFRHFD